jgi:TonB family protein
VRHTIYAAGIRHGLALAFALVGAAAAVAAAQADAPSDGAWGDRLYSVEDQEPPELLVESVDGFDGEGGWHCQPESDSAFATLKSFPSPASVSTGPGDKALGVKVEFLSRSLSSALLVPPRPIAVGPRCLAFSLRALGRSFRHELSIIVLDYYGRPYELSLGRLAFTGWKKLSAYVPPDDPATGLGPVQEDRHYSRPPGLRVAGIRIRFDPEESYGSFYLYLDSLEATIEGTGLAISRNAPSTAEPPEAEAPSPGAPKAETGAAPPNISQTAEASPPNISQIAEAAGKRILSTLFSRIASAMTYPAAARRRGLEGSLVVAFAVDSSGSLVSSRVVSSSGSDILDRAGLELLASVFPVDNDARSRLELRIPMSYKLAGSSP